MKCLTELYGKSALAIQADAKENEGEHLHTGLRNTGMKWEAM